MPQNYLEASHRKNGLRLQNEMVEKVVVQGRNCLRIPLTQGKFSLIDECDFKLISKYKWYAQKSSSKRFHYARTTISNLPIQIKTQMQNLIMNSQMVDHANRDGLDNRRCNLRVATRSQNGINRDKWKSNSTSKFKGVVFDQNKWMVRICLNYKSIFVGRFNDEITAAKEYDKKAFELFGERARFNFPICTEEEAKQLSKQDKPEERK